MRFLPLSNHFILFLQTSVKIYGFIDYFIFSKLMKKLKYSFSDLSNPSEISDPQVDSSLNHEDVLNKEMFEDEIPGE